MVISATDFQLRVNEYFTKLVKGEEIVIERYGKKFAVLISHEEYLHLTAKNTKLAEEPDLNQQVKIEKVAKISELNLEAETIPLTVAELLKLLKILLAKT